MFGQKPLGKRLSVVFKKLSFRHLVTSGTDAGGTDALIRVGVPGWIAVFTF